MLRHTVSDGVVQHKHFVMSMCIGYVIVMILRGQERCTKTLIVKTLFMSLTVRGYKRLALALHNPAHSSPIRPDRLLVATRNSDNVSNAGFGKLMI